MKALKEKRVSLRSLFRRGLVILSLFALVFAVSCSSSGEGSYDDGYKEGFDAGKEAGGGTTVKLPPVVTSMTVLNHPSNRSFEGAAPDLTGLSVMITIDDNGTKKMETVGPANFQVEPPVAYIVADNTTQGASSKWPGADSADAGVAGKSDVDASPYGRYQIKYVDPTGTNLSTASLVNVYIPTVVALDSWTNQGATNPATTGTLGTVYEDQPIDASGVSFRAVWVSDGARTNWAPANAAPDLGRTYTWTAYVGGTAESKPVSSSDLAWKIAGKGDAGGLTRPAQYMYQPSTGIGVAAKYVPATITDYYYVEKLVYKSGASRIAPVYADEPTFNETVYNNAAQQLAIQRAWLAKLVAAKLEFEVVYFRAGLESTGQKSRTIGMDDYLRAMWTTNANGTARASLPKPSGVMNGVNTSYSVIDSVYPDEVNFALRMFYYDERITGGAGAGQMNDISASWANAAIIDITTEGLIWVFREISVERIDSTSYMWNGTDIGAIPDILGRRSGAANFPQALQRYYANLMTHWAIGYIYENPNDTTKFKFFALDPQPGWGAAPGQVNETKFDITASDWEEIEEAAIGELTIQFDEPPSVGGVVGGGATEWAFQYRALP